MNYTVTAVKGTHDWDGDHGPMRDYLLEVDGADKAVELTQKRDTRQPTVGQVLDVELGPHPRFQERLKAKKVQKQGGFGGGGPRPEDPRRSKAILRQHSQSTAIAFLALRLKVEQAAGVQTNADHYTRDAVQKLTDWFDQDVERVREAA